MKKILISACLVGDKTRYDGKGSYNPAIESLLEHYELVPFCLEVEGGLSIPRDPAEIQHDGTIKTIKGKDVTRNYYTGLEKAINIIKYLNIKFAVLKEFSPACGTSQIYDGSFKGKKVAGEGILAKELRRIGVKVFNENEIEKLLPKKDEDKKE